MHSLQNCILRGALKKCMWSFSTLGCKGEPLRKEQSCVAEGMKKGVG